ncbi:signal transduction histidine kinase [Micrococcus sp. 093350064-1]
MGLWLTRRIAEEAGGVVDVATDSGTVFTVEVPREPTPQEET